MGKFCYFLNLFQNLKANKTTFIQSNYCKMNFNLFIEQKKCEFFLLYILKI